MNNTTTSIKYGIITGIFLIGYFYLLGVMGYIKSPIYSIFNALICALGIYLSILEQGRDKHFNYRMGFNTGIKTGVIATIIFTVFFAVFALMDNTLLDALNKQIGFIQMNHVVLIIATAVFGFISIYIVTYLLMEYFKKSWHLA